MSVEEYLRLKALPHVVEIAKRFSRYTEMFNQNPHLTNPILRPRVAILVVLQRQLNLHRGRDTRNELTRHLLNIAKGI